MTTRRLYVVALSAASLALVGTIGAAAAYAVNVGTAAATPAAVVADWNDGPGWTMDPDAMMGGAWGSSTDFTVSADQARAKAQAWLGSREPGATLGTAVQMPMGFRFPVSLNGTVVGVVIVNGVSGAVTGHAVTPGQSPWTDNWAGMMGQNWNTGTTFAITDAQAAAKARDWLASREPGATIGQAVRTPMGYRFIVSLNGTRVGVVMVNGVSGAVGGHAVASGSRQWTDNWSGMMGGNGSSGRGHMMGDWSSTSGWGGMMR